MSYKAEYIWIDGTEPTARLRSKTRILADGADLPDWGFDGSSTNQAPGDRSDCVLKPVFSCPDPIRGGDNKLVLCEVYLVDGTPHETNTRALLRPIAAQYEAQDSWYGIEQEYTFFKDGRPLGFPERGFPAPQGFYYCGVGADEVFGREIVERHLDACLEAGLKISGINAEVMPGQWEFQIGPAARSRSATTCGSPGGCCTASPRTTTSPPRSTRSRSRATGTAPGAHTNFSTRAMREGYDAIITACEALAEKAQEHVAGYGADIERRLTGMHETAPWSEFSYGVSNRGASVRIPWQVEVEKKGYIEDRRPNANVDPYVVARLITGTCCAALEKAGQV
ncbi:glutamine synthetase beta-grasp domain-containing protein [Actinomadura madurae]|uniref:glutamine synthetase beta-grasp domain-containing protein n=1 Tax=Actinomadura madurae TaxID=1993 RepID=UPI0020D20279|nr:glutamine synthetase beta-grasp domain-containing protein [Actinomadura madurae]MCQ0014764.1 glutamine synthetase beta-grasp domain-containing protein [Actinomadura madurae]